MNLTLASGCWVSLLCLAVGHANEIATVPVSKGILVETKLRPTPAGISGSQDSFGQSVSISGDRALVGASGLQGLGAAAVYRREGMAWVEEAILKLDDSEDTTGFGFDVSLDGDRALVSSFGAAFVFERIDGEWIQGAELDTEAVPGAEGVSVSLDGDRALVGRVPAPGVFGPTGPGAAVIFEFDGNDWIEGDTLSLDVLEDNFGVDVVLDGDRALVGASGFNERTGAAVVFERNGDSWTQTATLAEGDPMAGNSLGRRVELIGDRAFVSRDPIFGEDPTVVVFDFDGAQWLLADTLQPADEDDRRGFGTALSAEGDRLVVGAQFGNGSAGAAYVFDFDGNTWTESQRLTASDAMSGANLGSGVALAGDELLVGAPKSSAGSPGAGAVYVFELASMTWTETGTLFLEPGAGGSFFGGSVTLDGDRAAVGASEDGQRRGAAYVFDRVGDEWQLNAKLQPDEGLGEARAGASISLDGDRLLVGAADVAGENRSEGRALVYEFDGESWLETAVLVADAPGQGERFGNRVALLGDRALIGKDAFTGEPAVFVFETDGEAWTQSARLQPPPGAEASGFGGAIALGPDVAMVGADFGDGTEAFSGVVFIYEFDGVDWSEGTPLFPSDGASGDSFGGALSVFGESLLVSASSRPVGENSSLGVVYLFERSGGQWVETAQLQRRDLEATRNFGNVVSLAETRALIGGDGNLTDRAGTAFVFDLVDGEWRETQRLAPSDGRPGQSYGSAVAITADDALIGSIFDSSRAREAGSAYIPGSTDLIITNTAALTSVVPGGAQVFTITVTNAGPDDAPGARVENDGAADSSWTCEPDPGAVCPPTGTGALATEVDLPIGTSVVFTFETTAPGTALDEVTSTARVAPPGSLLEAAPADNQAVETVSIVPGTVDLAIEKTDDRTIVGAGGSTEYRITASNAGPDDVFAARVTDMLPAELTNGTWTCEANLGASCTAMGTGNIDDLVDLPADTSVVYTLRADVADVPLGTVISNTAEVAPPQNVGESSPDDNSATDDSEVSDIIFNSGFEVSELPP